MTNFCQACGGQRGLHFSTLPGCTCVNPPPINYVINQQIINHERIKSMSKNLEQEAVIKKWEMDTQTIQMHVINTLLSIMRDNSYIAEDRIKAAELLSKISSTKNHG